MTTLYRNNAYANAIDEDSVHVMLKVLSGVHRGLKVCYFNARSLNSSKLDYIRHTVNGVEIDVLCVSETWFKPDVSNHLLDIPNFTLIRNDRLTNTIGGGIAVYCRSSLKCKVLVKSSDSQVEYMVLEISDGSMKCCLGCVYNPSRNFSPTPFFTALSEFLPHYEHIFICGDFNTNLLTPNSCLSQLLDAISASGLTVMNRYPTRYAPNDPPSLLDLLVVSNPSNVLLMDQLSLEGLSDHDLLYCTYNIDFSHSQVPLTFQYRDVKSVNISSLSCDAYCAPWDGCKYLSNIDDKLDFVQSIIAELFEAHVPLKTVRIRNTKCPWYTSEAQASIKNRRKHYRRWRSNPTPRNWELYCQARNQATWIIRSAKRNYFASKLNVRLSSKQLWSNLRAIGVSNREKLNCLLDPNELNDEFLANTSSQLSSVPFDEPLDQSQYNFDFATVAESEVLATVQALKSNAVGEDGIPLWFVKLILPHFLGTLTHIINYCITSSTFPLLWKRARVTPVAKKSQPLLPSDYRPISILPCLSKISEKILAGQVVRHLESNGLLSQYQSGFRANHSCSTAMVKVLDDIRHQFDKDCLTVLCLLDFSKAFDRVNHKVLCGKLVSYFGFSTRAALLIENYLKDRTQRVDINGVISEARDILAGVPQGSILGPILFCMYINDLPKVCKNVSFHLYADDIQIYLSRPIGLIEDLICRTNEDLNAIQVWSVANGLTLNPRKTQAILFSKRGCNTGQFPSLYLGNFKIPYMESLTSLGYKLTSNLSCNDHVNFVVGRIYGALRKLWQSSDFTPLETKLHLVKSLLIPIISYFEVVYPRMDSCSEHKLLVAFNSMTRYIYGLRRFDHISAYQTKILGCTLLQYFNARNCIFLHKIIQTRSPSYLYSKLIFCQSRRTLNIVIPTFNYLNSSRLFFVNSTRVWNSLPTSTRQITNLTKFRKEVFRYFSDQH